MVKLYHSSVIKKSTYLIKKHILPDSLLFFCQKRLDLLTKRIHEKVIPPCIEIPYLLSYGLCYDQQRAENVATLCTFFYLGCDLLDDWHDNALPAEEQCSPSTVSLAVSLFLHSLPIQTLGEFCGAEKERCFFACQALAACLQKMAIGQMSDLHSHFQIDCSAEQAEATVITKSGEEMALFCSLGALLTGSEESIRSQCSAFGRFFGVSLQLVSDVMDIFDNRSNDLKNGTCTMPLALHLLRLKEEDKRKFCQLWKQSFTDPLLQRRLQNELLDSGALAHTAIIIEDYCEKAREELMQLPIKIEERSALEEKIEVILQYAIFYLRSFLNLKGEKYGTPENFRYAPSNKKQPFSMGTNESGYQNIKT